MQSVVVSGFSGVGKGAIVKRLLKLYPNEYTLSISATTRSPRNGEENGREYFFVSEEDFQKMISEHKLLEYMQYGNHYYGTPSDFSSFCKDKENVTVIFEIDVRGGLTIKKNSPDTKLIFIIPPSVEELQKRLAGRNTETKEEITIRMNRAMEEIDSIRDYEYIICNDTLENAVQTVHDLSNLPKTDTKEKEAIIQKLREDFQKILSV